MNSLLWWLGQNTFTVAVMIPFVLLACRLFRNRPAVQHVLWVVVLLKFVTPPVVFWPWTAQQVRDSIWSASVSSLPADESVRGYPALATVVPTEFDDESATDLKGAEVGTMHAGAAPVAAANEGPAWIWITLRIVTIIWIVGAATCLIWQLRRIVRHASLVRRGSAAPRPLMDEIHTVALQLGLRPPQALIARGILSPFVWCLGRLRLVWPESLSGRAEIVRSRGVIAHELAHVRRGDHRVAWLELIAAIVWWWNPLFWFVRRCLRETAEMACDALAIGTCPASRREYAELLLELSAGFKTGAPAPVLAVSAGTPSSFERRLSMILSDNVSGKLSSWGLLAAVGLALVALPGWSLGKDEPAHSSTLDTPATKQVEPPSASALDTIEQALAVFDDTVQPSPTSPLNEAKSSVADDSVLRDLIEAGRFDEAKARLEALRAKGAANNVVRPRPVIGFKGNERFYWMTFEEKGANLRARGITNGRTIWKSQFADSLPDRTSEDKWTLVETKDQKVVVLTWIRKDDRTQYTLDLATGKIIQVLNMANADDRTRDAAKGVIGTPLTDWGRRRDDAGDDRERANSALAAVKDHLKRLQGSPAAGGDELDFRRGESSLDLAERYLKAVTDLKLARSRLARLEKAGEGSRTQKDLDEAHISLEQAEKLVQLLSGYIKDAVNSARAAVATAEVEIVHVIALHKKGYIAPSEVDAAKARVEEAKARVRQLEAIMSIVSPAAPASTGSGFGAQSSGFGSSATGTLGQSVGTSTIGNPMGTLQFGTSSTIGTTGSSSSLSSPSTGTSIQIPPKK